MENSNTKKSLFNTLFNLKEKLHHSLTSEEIELVKNTHLFDKLDIKISNSMLKAITLVKYTPGELILKEGSVGEAIYIISEGSVRIYTLDKDGEKIPLARLNKGGYFGEQALLGQSYRTRNANIEAITETTLIVINEKYFYSILEVDEALKANLKKTGYQQTVTALTSLADFYGDFQEILEQIDNPSIVELSKDELIFNVGDKPDNVYIILQGEVKLQIPHKEDSAFSSVILHKGHLFGELGVLKDKPRAATAIAQTPVRLLSLIGEEFKKYAKIDPKLQQVLSSLQHVYQIPMQGTVEQYIGNVENLGGAITNIYKMEHGRSVVSSNFVNTNVFTMSTAVTFDNAKHYIFSNGKNEITLDYADQRIVSIKATGLWDNLPQICRVLLENTIIDENQLVDFQKTGRLKTGVREKTLGQNEIICECMSVSRGELQKLIDEGIRDLSALSKITGACTSCRGCTFKILEMLGENPWVSAIIKKVVPHNSYMNSYYVSSTSAKFKSFKPGQHIIVQMKVNDNWIERPYTISGIEEDDTLRITVKKEPQGFFTQWLFEQALENFVINATQPQGNFILNMTQDNSVVCFAGGIGITPFITFARTLLAEKNTNPLHIVYFASTTDDFIFKNEFAEITQQMPSITVQYRATREEGPLVEEDIINSVKRFNEPEVYICGSEGFIKKIHNSLQLVNYNPAKIILEEFVHAGSAPSA